MFRDGEQRALKVTVGELGAEKSGVEAETQEPGEESQSSSDLGLTVEPFTADKAGQYHLSENDKGFLSPAWTKTVPLRRPNCAPAI